MLQLENDMISLAEPESRIDPKFQTAFKYTHITAKAMREALARTFLHHALKRRVFRTIGIK